MPSQKKSGALLGYANIVLKNLVNLIYVPLLLHFLGQADYGVFQMTNSVVFALTILSAGFYGSYVRFYMRERARGCEDTGSGIRKLNGMFLLVYLAVAILCIIGGIFMVIYVRNIFSGGLTPDEINLARVLLSIMIVNVAVTMISTPFDSYIVAHERFIFQQSRQLFTVVAQPFIAAALLLLGTGAVGVAIAQLTISTILLLLNIRYSVKRLNMRFTVRGIEWSLFKAVAAFSFWIFLNQIFDLVNNNVPNFLLGAMDSAKAVAVFSIAMQIRNIFFSMSTTMSNVFIPQVNRIVAENDDNKSLTLLMARVGRYQMVVFWYLFGGFIILGQYFVKIWAGNENANAYWLALIMVLPVMIPLTQNLGIEIQRAKNKHKVRSLIYILTSAIDIVITALFIPKISYWAAALGYIASIVLGTGIFMNWYYHKHIGLNMAYFWRHQTPTMGLACVVIVMCVVGTRLLPIDTIWTFILWGIMYSTLFIAGAMRVSLTPDERAKITQRIRKTIHR